MVLRDGCIYLKSLLEQIESTMCTENPRFTQFHFVKDVNVKSCWHHFIPWASWFFPTSAEKKTLTCHDSCHHVFVTAIHWIMGFGETFVDSWLFAGCWGIFKKQPDFFVLLIFLLTICFLVWGNFHECCSRFPAFTRIPGWISAISRWLYKKHLRFSDSLEAIVLKQPSHWFAAEALYNYFKLIFKSFFWHFGIKSSIVGLYFFGWGGGKFNIDSNE